MLNFMGGTNPYVLRERDGRLSLCRSRRHRNSAPVHWSIVSAARGPRHTWRISKPSRLAGADTRRSRFRYIAVDSPSMPFRIRLARLVEAGDVATAGETAM